MRNKTGQNLGELQGFIIGGSVTYEYETDLRRIAKIQTRNDNYIPFAMIEIQCTTDEGDSAVMGVFCVKDVKEKTQGDITIKDYDLASVAYKAQTYCIPFQSHFIRTVRFGDILGYGGIDDGIVHYGYRNGCENFTRDYGEDGLVTEAGTSALEFVKKRCDEYNCRYQPQSYDIMLEPYVNPSQKPVQFTFSKTNGTMCSEVEIEQDKYTSANEVITTYNNNDIHIVGYAQAQPSSGISINQREQKITEKYSIDSMNPETQWMADQIAREHLEKIIKPNMTLSFTGVYCGVHDGDVVSVEYKPDEFKKCVLLSVEVALDNMMETKYKARVIN